MTSILSITLSTYLTTNIIYFSSACIFDYLSLLYPKSKHKTQQQIVNDKTKIDWVRGFKLSFINMVCILPILICIMTYVIRHKLRMNKIIWSYDLLLTLCYLITIDFFFYVYHRIFHLPFLYQRIHKIHHYWTKPWAIHAMSCHMLEIIFVNILSVMSSPLLYGKPHVKFITLYIALSTLSSTISHSGWGFIARHHDNHHKYITCNYGVLGIMDKIMKTCHISD
jgi:sterol desaturase/sphingolipid hydroxylase (fatty acid hydroxylase superfamily)